MPTTPAAQSTTSAISVAPKVVGLTVELAYYTGQRRSDLLKLRLSELMEQGIRIRRPRG